MNKTKISEKEFAVIKEITNNNLPDQRVIAKKVGISLGLTNLIIKQLAKKGYLKIRQLNRRKVQYLLTPKGFTEKARKSYRFTLRTISTLKSMKQKIQEIILTEYNRGRREFVISGNGEINDLIELALRNLAKSDIKICHVQGNEPVPFRKPFFLYTKSKNTTQKQSQDGISLISVLSEEVGSTNL